MKHFPPMLERKHGRLAARIVTLLFEHPHHVRLAASERSMLRPRQEIDDRIPPDPKQPIAKSPARRIRLPAIDRPRHRDQHLLRQLLSAQQRTEKLVLPPDAPPAYRAVVDEERARLVDEAGHVGHLVMEFLQLAAAKQVIEAIPEAAEALRLAHAVASLSAPRLVELQLLLGSGPAACGVS